MNPNRASPSEAAASILLTKAVEAQLAALCFELDLSKESISGGERAIKIPEIWQLAEQKGGTTLARLEEILCAQQRQPAPDYWLYFNCSEADRVDPLCRTFFTDLTDRLRDQLTKAGQPPAGEIRFFDERNVQDATTWFPWSLRAMQRCRALVCLYSRAYFSDPYCGRIWKAFSDRRTDPGNGPASRFIFPILWKPQTELTSVLPKVTRNRDVLVPKPPYDKGGLRALLELALAKRENWKAIYDAFVDEFAQRLLAAVQSAPLPEDLTVPALGEIRNLFFTPFDPQKAEKEKGTDFVKFIFVAAQKSEIEEVRDSGAYGDAAGAWRPYHPVSQDYLSAVGYGEAAKLNMVPDAIPVNADLERNFRSIETTGNLVLVIIDPWTLQLGSYNASTAVLHRQLLERGTILVCWNNDDSETQGSRAVLLSGLENVFPKVLSNRYPDRFRNEIASVGSLREELSRALISTRRAVVDGTSAPKEAQGLPYVRPDSIVALPALIADLREVVRKAGGYEGAGIIQPHIEGPKGQTQL